MTRTPTRRALLAAATALAVPLAGCGGDEPAGDAAATGTPVTAAPSEVPASAAPAPTGPFGAGCAALPAEGEGSPAGMADDPVAVAMANVPPLAHMVTTARFSTLLDSLNVTEDLTVLAPANPAFEAVPSADIERLLADTPRLTSLVTHHVISGRLAPGELAGTHTTLNGDRVTIEGSGDTFTISADQTFLGAADAAVVCGNLQTRNATVYVLDQVLAPPD